MERIELYLKIITGLLTLLPLLLSKTVLKNFKTKIEDTFLQALPITSLFFILYFFNFPYNFKSPEEFFENLLFVYAVVSLSMFISKLILVELAKLGIIRRRLPFWENIFQSLFLFSFFLGIFLVFISSDIFGVNVKFTEDVSAKIVENENTIYKVKIPKDTVIILNISDIIQKGDSLEHGESILDLYLTENVIKFKKFKKVPFRSIAQLYLAKDEVDEETLCFPENQVVNLDSVNIDQTSNQFLSETKVYLREDKKVELLKDTRVEISERGYKYLCAFIFLLISIFTASINFINGIFVTNKTKKDRKRKRSRERKIFNNLP